MARQTFTAAQVLTAAQVETLEANGGWNLDLNAQTGTTYTLVLADQGIFVTCDNASAIVLTVPPNSSVAFPIGDQVNIMQSGAGQVTITAGAGVTLRSSGTKLKTTAQYSVATILKIATDTWVVVGSLSA